MKMYESMREEGKKKYRQESKDRLKRIYTTKITTAFVGALAKFEEKLGFLWNEAEEEDWQKDLKETLIKDGYDEAYFNEIWQEIRNAVLTNGNNQVRSLDKEIEQYSVVWERYQKTFPVASTNVRSMSMPEGGYNG